MQFKLKGQIALITGGWRGIGAATAKRLAGEGAKVAITYAKGADAAASAVKEIESAGCKFDRRQWHQCLTSHHASGSDKGLDMTSI